MSTRSLLQCSPKQRREAEQEVPPLRLTVSRFITVARPAAGEYLVLQPPLCVCVCARTARGGQQGGGAEVGARPQGFFVSSEGQVPDKGRESREG